MRKKDKSDPKLVDTNKGFREHSGTLAWLTQSAIRVSGLDPYENVKKNNVHDLEFRQWNRVVLLGMFFWGAGFIYVEKAFLAAVTFFFLVALSMMFISTAWNLNWLPIELPSVPAMMIFGAMIVLLWSISVVMPLYFVHTKKRQKNFFSIIFSWLGVVAASIIFWRINALLDDQIIHGWQFEDELVLLTIVGLTCALVLFGEVLSMLVGLFGRFFATSEKGSGFKRAYVGFWLGVAMTIGLFFTLAGPLSDTMKEKVGQLSQALKNRRFEKIPRYLDYFLIPKDQEPQAAANKFGTCKSA